MADFEFVPVPEKRTARSKFYALAEAIILAHEHKQAVLLREGAFTLSKNRKKPTTFIAGVSSWVQRIRPDLVLSYSLAEDMKTMTLWARPREEKP